MEITIVVNLGRTATLDARLSAAIHRALYAGTEDATILLLREMKVYPAKRRGSAYVRTKILEKSWHRKVKRTATGATGEVVSSGQTAPYNVYVQKEGMQAAVHRGRWPSEVSVATRLQPQIVRMYETRVAQAVSRA